jgi:aerobic-type carbon monoxide dehydrogenase small subunit (CoxS/CutS family)
MSDTIALELDLNRRRIQLDIQPNETLADVLRNRLALTGTKVSCDAQVCGTCTVLLDGLAVSSCTLLAADADGRRITTVEGLADPEVDGPLSRLQRAFIDRAAFQCGYCTPGFLMSATALLAEIRHPTRQQVIEYLDGNICRCTGYDAIVEAVLDAARDEKEAR